MKMILFVANLFSFFCIVAAAVLAYLNRDGWGWFLFIALLTHTGLSGTDEEKEKCE